MAIVPASFWFKGVRTYGVDALTGSVGFDLVLAENHNYDSEVTSHPVEIGGEISDHIQNELKKGDITALISNYSINTPFAFSNRAEDVFKALVSFWEQKTLLTMTTILNVYNNVAITNMPITLDEDSGDSMTFQISFREVKVVTLQEISIEATISVPNLGININRQVAPPFNAGRVPV